MFAGEDFPTFTATEMRFSSVNFLMCPQAKQVAEHLPTFLTHMGCFSSVSFSVLNQG